jgi:hypothetical protein
MEWRNGDRVTVAEWVRPSYFAGLTGTVDTWNDGEVGVKLDARHGHGLTWFRPGELEQGSEAAGRRCEPSKRTGRTVVPFGRPGRKASGRSKVRQPTAAPIG